MAKFKDIERRTIRIKLIEGTRINGQVNLNRQEGHDRVSDLIGATNESIVVVFNATIYENALENPVHVPTVFINKRHILWAMPDDSQK